MAALIPSTSAELTPEVTVGPFPVSGPLLGLGQEPLYKCDLIKRGRSLIIPKSSHFY